MTKLELNQIGFFNPGRLTDKEIELHFVARKKQFQFIFEKIRSNNDGNIPQHLLIIGQRGMGKSSILMRLAVELRKVPYNKNYIPLTFPEEQYNVDRLQKFWLNALDALADALDREGKNEWINELDREIDRLKTSPLSSIYEVFSNWTKKIGRRPVLLVDNLNLIFNKISKEEQHKLRATLNKKNAPIIIGASASTIKETIDYAEPFYDAFQTQYLKKLSLEESWEVLRNLSELTQKPLLEQLPHMKGKVTAFYQLTGGSPRALTMLFPLLADGVNSKIQHDLEALLDIITPLYKARFEELPDQLQIILDAIALHWDPINLKKLRELTRLENSKLSPQLNRLLDIGWIQKTQEKVKGAYYEISERFFNVWYLMRRSSRRQKRELYCLSRFLEAFYGEDLLNIAKERLKLSSNTLNDVSWDLAIAEGIGESEISNSLKEKAFKNILEYSMSDMSVLTNYTIPQERISKEILALGKKAVKNAREGSFNIAYEIIEGMFKLNELPQISYTTKSVVLVLNKKYEEAERAILQSIKIDATFEFQWELLNFIYKITNKPKKQKKPLLKVLDLNPENYEAWNDLANLHRKEYKDFEKAEQAFQKSLEIKEDYVPALEGVAKLYYEQNLSEKAERVYLKLIKLNPKQIVYWSQLGGIYLFDLTDLKKASKAIDKALQINSDYNPVIFLQCIKEFYFTYNFSGAKSVFEKFENQDNSKFKEKHLVLIYRDYSNQVSKAKQLLDSIKKDVSTEYYHLQQTIFNYIDNNLGLAKDNLTLALNKINHDISEEERIDEYWTQAAAMAVKYGNGKHFAETIKENGFDIVLRPYYEAIKALHEEDSEAHLSTIAAEVREPTQEIVKEIKKYIV